MEQVIVKYTGDLFPEQQNSEIWYAFRDFQANISFYWSVFSRI